MNESIKELAVKAGMISAEYNGFDSTSLTESQKKFAELIIVKCANIIWNEADMKDSAEINEGGYKILEHFGIEWRGEQNTK